MPVPTCPRKDSERGLILQGIKCQSAPSSHVRKIKFPFWDFSKFALTKVRGTIYIHKEVFLRLSLLLRRYDAVDDDITQGHLLKTMLRYYNRIIMIEESPWHNTNCSLKDLNNVRQTHTQHAFCSTLSVYSSALFIIPDYLICMRCTRLNKYKSNCASPFWLFVFLLSNWNVQNAATRKSGKSWFFTTLR